MKSTVFLFFTFCLFLIVPAWGQQQAVKIVILGSSTAAGGGASSKSNSWVGKYESYLKSVNPENKVINLAVGGFKIYQIMPTGFVPPWGAVNTSKNITTGLSHNPDAIIINLPTNDAVAEVPVNEQLVNYNKILDLADAQKVPVWITTTQPRNLNQTALKILLDMKDSTFTHLGDKALDFWTDFANEDGSVNPDYDSGDHTHLNDAAHNIMFRRVVDAGILGYITGKFLQAENYLQASNIETESKYSRNSNRGFIRIKKNTNASVSFKVKAESTTSLDLKIRHSNQNETIPGELLINGVAHSTLNFAPTKSELIWNKVPAEIELAKGENIIELKFSGLEENICLDFIEWDNSLVTYDISTSNNLLSDYNEIKAFPVPFKNELKLSNIPNNCSVKMFSVTGIKMLDIQGVSNDVSINTSGYNSGIYILQIMDKAYKSSILKVVKK